MTQNEKILRHIDQFGSITAYEAMRDYGIMRLASRVADLKRAGYNISSVRECGYNRFGESTHFSRYRLED